MLSREILKNNSQYSEALGNTTEHEINSVYILLVMLVNNPTVSPKRRFCSHAHTSWGARKASTLTRPVNLPL